MKNFSKLIAIVTAITFSATLATLLVTACDSDNTPTEDTPRTVTYVSNANGNIYTLTITEKTDRAAYTAQAGDSYVLKITYANDTTKTSSGTVSARETDGSLKLLPSGATEPFTVAINSSGVGDISGKIIFADGSKEEGPGAVTPVTPPPTAGNGSLGATLTITNTQVYTFTGNNDDGYEFTPNNTLTKTFTHVVITTSGESDIKTLNEFTDGAKTVTLTNGKLTVSLGAPKAALLTSIDPTMMQGVTISPTDAKFLMIRAFTDSANPDSFIIQSSQTEQVLYMYVDKNVTVNGTLRQEYNDGEAFYNTVMAMDLKTGWNSVIMEMGENGYIQKTGKPTADHKWYVQETPEPEGPNEG
jgi:hypothetical protein